MLRRVTVIVGATFALLLFVAPGWTQFRGRGATMGSMSFSHSPGGFASSFRGFPAFGTGTSTSRSAFMGSMNRVVPTASGLAVVSSNGTFTPSAHFVSPAAFVSPLANTFVNQSAYNRTLRHYERVQDWASGYNPYLYGGYGYGGFGYGGYGYGNPYGGYGVPYYGAGYGYGASNPYAGAPANANPQPVVQVAANGSSSAPQAKSSDALKAFGIPVEFGEVKWPLALRLMPPETKRDLLDKLDSQMKLAANQAVNGNASQTPLRETKSTIDSVKWWLRGRQSNISESTYQDGDAFLRQLEESLRRKRH